MVFHHIKQKEIIQMKKYTKIISIVSALSISSLIMGITIPTIIYNHNKNTNSNSYNILKSTNNLEQNKESGWNYIDNLLTTSANASSNTTQENNFIYNAVVNDLSYDLNLNTFSATVNGFYQVGNSNKLIIPQNIIYNGVVFQVNSIKEAAFYNNGLQSVVLPNTIISIGANAFNTNYISSIVLPSSLLFLGNNAFSNNLFPYGYTVYMPSNTSWDVSRTYAPFDTNNNYSNFTSCVQYIIQNDEVYTFRPHEESWAISSYLPSFVNNPNHLSNQLNKDNKSIDYANNVYLPVINGQGNGNSPEISNNYTHSVGIAFQSKNIAQTSLDFSSKIIITFDPDKMQIDSHLLSYQSSFLPNMEFTIYNPNTNNYIYDQSFSPNSTSSQVQATFGNGISFNYGDIITFYSKPTPTWNWLLISTNYNPSMLQNVGLLNTYYYTANSWSEYVNNYMSFRITPIGLVPYVNPNHLNPPTVLGNNTTSFNLTGNGIPNIKWTVDIAGKQFSAFANAQGKVIIPITLDDSSFTTSNFFNWNTSNSPKVITHLLGQNPIGSAIYLNLWGKINFGITFHNNSLMLISDGGPSSVNLPSYATITNNSWGELSDPSNGTIIDTKPIPFQMKIISPNGNVQYNYFYMDKNTTVESIQKFLSGFTFTVGDVMQISGPNEMFGTNYNTSNNVSYPYGPCFVSNNKQMPLNYQTINNTVNINDGKQFSNPLTYKNASATVQLTYEQNGVLIDSLPSSQVTGTFSKGYGLTTTPNYGDPFWGISNWSIAGGWSQGWYGAEETGTAAMTQLNGYSYFGSNFYDPSKLMWQVVSNIVSGTSNQCDQVIGIMTYVQTHTMYGTDGNLPVYNRTIQQQFNGGYGICGNYSNLSAVMLSMAGFVSRVIIGSTTVANNWNTSPVDINHAWTQVWIPQIKEWITLDATWAWYTPFGRVYNEFNVQRGNEEVSVTFFPQGTTNYWNFFQGDEQAALWNLGNFFNTSAGNYGTVFNTGNAVSLINLINALPNLNQKTQSNPNGYAYASVIGSSNNIVLNPTYTFLNS